MPRGKGLQRSKEQILADHERISDLLVIGHSPSTILKTLNAERPYKLAQRTVQKDISDIRDGWSKVSHRNIAQHVERELRLLNRIGLEAMDAWERSKAQKTKGRTTKAGKAIKTDQGNRDGASEYLALAIKCSEQRCKLLGIGRERREISGPDGLPIPVTVQGDPMRLEVVLIGAEEPAQPTSA